MNFGENAEKFIALYNEIDHILRTMLHEEVWVGFRELVERSAKFNRVVREYEDDLKQIGDLRNVIVHRTTDKIIAEPSDYIVNLTRKIRDLLKEPPKVIPYFEKNVVTIQSSESALKLARTMKNLNFSKIPVYNGNEFVFLATAETLVRYFAENADRKLSDTRIYEMQEFAEHKDNYRFISKNTDIFKAADIFEIYYRNKQKLDAIIITENGEKDQKPIGIITQFDVGEIYKLMEIRVNNNL
jgi:predicted transcriptional regulator